MINEHETGRIEWLDGDGKSLSLQFWENGGWQVIAESCNPHMGVSVTLRIPKQEMLELVERTVMKPTWFVGRLLGRKPEKTLGQTAYEAYIDSLVKTRPLKVRPDAWGDTDWRHQAAWEAAAESAAVAMMEVMEEKDV